MKNLLFVLSLLLLMNCKKNDDDSINNCNYLLNVGINTSISLNLYSQLTIPFSPVYIPNLGNGGVYVINIGSNYRAYDAFDPNHIPNTCSYLRRNVDSSGFEVGTIVTCGCADENEYDLVTGLPQGGQLPCALQEYRVTANGSELTITN